MSTPIRFYFDFISPYAYLAWTQLHALAARHGRAVEARPVLFAALLNHHGQLGPAEIPAKRLYVFKDTLRTALTFGVPFAPPPSHPFNPLLALRVCALDMAEETRRGLIDALFGETWGGGQGITDAEHVAAIALELGVADPIERATSDEGKARVRALTDEAIAQGAFGVPTMIVDGELFWGLDSFGHMERALTGADPLRAVDLGRWSNVQASAMRPGSKRSTASG